MPVRYAGVEFDWDEGFAIPIANSDNKKLEEDIVGKEKQITDLQAEISKHDEVLAALSSHLKNVRQELSHTQNLLLAKERELESEDHMTKLASREEARIVQDMKRIDQVKQSLNERKNAYQNAIFAHTKVIEEMKSAMKWDQKELEKWLELSAKKDEDAMIIQKYTRQDEGKIKELTLRMEKLTADVQSKRRQLEEETMNAQIAQIELDKTAEEFRRAHEQRRELIAQWEHTIELMQRRDREMDALYTQLAQARDRVSEREAIIRDKQRYLEKERDSVVENEKAIDVNERQIGRLKEEAGAAERARTQFADELEALRRTVDRTAVELEAVRAQVAQLKKDAIEKHARLRQVQELRARLEERLKAETNSMLSAEERAKKLEQLLAQEEQRQKAIEQELKSLRELQFRKQEELHQNRQMEKTTEAEIQGTRASVRNLNSKITRLDEDALKQQEVLYNQDFTIQQLERRIGRMQGEQSDEEKVHLQARIKELEAVLEEKKATESLLREQLKRLQEDTRKRKRDLEVSTQERTDLLTKINELELYISSSEKELRILISRKQDLMVEENILKVKANKMRQNLSQRADSVMTIEKRRLQLETAMKERLHEISLYKTRQLAEQRGADAERQQLSAELHERCSKIEKLKKRYELLMVAMAPPEGEEEKSQAYYVIRAAQEKEDLQRHGDELDARIRKSEKEIQALENTLRVLNSRNETYRRNFNKVSETSDEVEQRETNEAQLRAIEEKLRQKRRALKEIEEDFRSMQEALESLSREEAATAAALEQRESACAAGKREIDELEARAERASTMATRLSRDLRRGRAANEIESERDIDVRDQLEFNRELFRQVGVVVEKHPEERPLVRLYFQQANLPAPDSLEGSSLAGSASSASSVGSSRQSTPASVRSQNSSRNGAGSAAGAGAALPMARVDLGADLPPQSPASGNSRRSSRSNR